MGSLGRGGFAEVFLAEDPQLGGKVAIKVLKTRAEDDPELHERFLGEARALRKAESGRVVRVYDIGELEDGRPYLVMEYANAGTLEDRLASQPDRPPALLDPAVALRHGAEIARGVAALHRVKVAHRDIKPSNVLFHTTPAAGERLLIADLGVSKDLTDTRGYTRGAGTAGYMAPEQGIGIGITDRVDLYGVGAVVYRALTGKVPASGAPPTPPSRLRPGLPPGADNVLLRALAADPQHRHTSAEELAHALDQLAHAAADPPAGSPRRRWALLATAGLALISITAAAAWHLTPKTPVAQDPAETARRETPAPSPSTSSPPPKARFGQVPAPAPSTSRPSPGNTTPKEKPGKHCAAYADGDTSRWGCADSVTAAHNKVGGATVALVRFYDNANYGGDTLTYYGPRSCTSDRTDETIRSRHLFRFNYDNRASSVTTYNNCRVRLYANDNYGIPRSGLISQSADLRNVDDDWNDRMSSLQVT